MLALSNRVQHAIVQSNLPATPSTTAFGTTLTANVLPHNKGTYATLLTATYDIYGFYLVLGNSGAAGTLTDMMLDVAKGPNQENVIIPEYTCGWRAARGFCQYYPIFIEAGALISARIQALITLDTLDLIMFANAGASGIPEQLFSGCDAYGTNSALSRGTSHTPGNSGAESTAADIGSTTTKDYGAIMFSQNGTLANTTMNASAYHWELLFGGQVRAEWYTQTETTETYNGPFPTGPRYLSIPTGTQLRVQAECAATAQAQDMAYYCFF